ncbi:MAG: hypothetical protein OSB03_02290 [Vicinamibacterales bacterium]|nr:hypothetical protein [Vicinamibacterales bacterium]
MSCGRSVVGVGKRFVDNVGDLEFVADAILTFEIHLAVFVRHTVGPFDVVDMDVCLTHGPIGDVVESHVHGARREEVVRQEYDGDPFLGGRVWHGIRLKRNDRVAEGAERDVHHAVVVVTRRGIGPR